MGILVLWLIFAVVGALIGSAKGRVLAGFLWGLFLGPLGWLIIAVAGGSGKRCPACRSWIDRQASVCPKCGRDISQPPGQGQVQTVSATSFFPHCGAPRHEGLYCAGCGKPLPAVDSVGQGFQPIATVKPTAAPTSPPKWKRRTKILVFSSLGGLYALLMLVRFFQYEHRPRTPAVPPRPKPAISLSSGCFSPSAKSADVLAVAKQYAARQTFHDLQCAKLLLGQIPKQDQFYPEALRLQASYTSAQKQLVKRRALEAEKQAEAARVADSKRAADSFLSAGADVAVRAVGPRKQTLLIRSPLMDRVLVYNMNSVGNCASFRKVGFTKIEAQNSVTGDSWTLCLPK